MLRRFARDGFNYVIKSISLYLNDIHVKDVAFASTGDWYTFKVCDLTIDIPAGASLKIQYDENDEPINVDYIDFNQSAIAPKPVVTPKPVAVTAAKKAIAKNLAIQVKKVATANGAGLAALIGKNGLTVGLGYHEEGLVYNEANIKANLVPKDRKNLATLKVGTSIVNLAADLKLLKDINAAKPAELALNANLTMEDFRRGEGNGTEKFQGILYQPNGDIVIAGWQFNGGIGTWLFFKAEGKQYKLYKVVAMED